MAGDAKLNILIEAIKRLMPPEAREQFDQVLREVEQDRDAGSPPSITPFVTSWAGRSWSDISLHVPQAIALMDEAIYGTFAVVKKEWYPRVEKWIEYLDPSFKKTELKDELFIARIRGIFTGPGLVMPTFSERTMFAEAKSLMFIVRRMLEYGQDPEVYLDTSPAFQYGFSEFVEDEKQVEKLEAAYRKAGQAYWLCARENSVYPLMDHIDKFELGDVRDKIERVVFKIADFSLLRHLQDKHSYSRNPEGYIGS